MLTRFCLVCQVFKPERTHHCSTCKRCVLVMDHHCPWLNNCVGFKNRKTFMLLIIYALVISIVGLLGSVYPLVLLGIQIGNQDYRNMKQFVMGLIACGLGVAFMIVMINFNIYHFYLVNNNKVTFYSRIARFFGFALVLLAGQVTLLLF